MQKIINAETLAGVYTGNFRTDTIEFLSISSLGVAVRPTKGASK